MRAKLSRVVKYVAVDVYYHLQFIHNTIVQRILTNFETCSHEFSSYDFTHRHIA